MKLDKKQAERLKYAVFLAVGLLFYFRGELVQMLPGHAPDPAIALLKEGALAYQAADYKKALAVAEMVVNRFPNSPNISKAHLLEGMAMQKMRNPKAVAELHIVTEHYAGTLEAKVAAQSLREIGASAQVKPPAPPGKEPDTPDTNALTAVHAPGNFVGAWQSQPVTIPNRGACHLKMEVRAQEQGFSAYPELSCMLLPTLDTARKYQGNELALMQKMTMRGTPFSAVLSGAWDTDYRSLIFKVVDTTSTDESGCIIAGDAKATPFGGTQLAVRWKDSCGQDLQFMLTRQPAVKTMP